MFKNIALTLGSFLLCFTIIEICYRIFDPFPFYSQKQMNVSEYGNLSMYDPLLGWKGVPGGKTTMTTYDSQVMVAHNKLGFRDIEHGESTKNKPAVVFLGDSFTWGYEVEFEDMFVSRLRNRLQEYELFNLGHQGYGTDQALLTFSRWYDGRPLKYVILMFYENDVIDNNSRARYQKPKPIFRIADNELILTGVPVPKAEGWTGRASLEKGTDSWKDNMKTVLLSSHFLHDVYFRKDLLLRPSLSSSNAARNDGIDSDLTLTAALLEQLKREVEERGAKLAVFFVPSKNEIQHLNSAPPYQIEIAKLCKDRGIESYDLAPDLKASWFRTYYRKGGHWNSRGNEIAASVLYRFLTREVKPFLSSTPNDASR